MFEESIYRTKELKITADEPQNRVHVQLCEGWAEKSVTRHTLKKVLEENVQKEVSIFICPQKKSKENVFEDLKTFCIQHCCKRIYLRSHSSLLFSHYTDKQHNRSIHTPAYSVHFSAHDGCFSFTEKKQHIQPFDHSFKEILATIRQDRPITLSFSFIPYHKEHPERLQSRLSNWSHLLKNIAKDVTSIQKIEIYSKSDDKQILFAQAHRINGKLDHYNIEENAIPPSCCSIKGKKRKVLHRIADAAQLYNY